MTKKYVSLALTVLIIGAVGAWLLWFSENHPEPKVGETPSSPVSQAALASYTNERGQEWSIPRGEYDFSVASAETYPKFVIGFINPLDVKVGDTQKMMIAINGDQPVSRVWAEIETDTGTRIVDLRLDATSTVSYSDLMKQRYIVDQKGNLIINKGDSEWKRVVDSIVNKASAADPVLQYTYVGEWKVVDTHTKTYHTKFVAQDSSGRSDAMTLAWSDPVCDFDSAGNLLGSCNATNTTEGPDKSLSLSGNTVTLGSGGILAFPPGGSISIGTGNLSLGGGSIQKKYLCMADNDNDGFIGNVALITSDSSSCTGYQKRESNVYYAYGTQIKNGGGSSSGTPLAFFENETIKKAYSFLEHFIQQAFAVGPCPGNPNCPGPMQQTWANTANAIGAANGTEAYAGPIGNPDSSQYLRVYNYGFTFPSTATSTAQATDIKITVRARVSGGSVNMAAFEGTAGPVEQMGNSQTVSATSLTDYVFESAPPTGTIQASQMNFSNFGSFVQVYDGASSPVVYVDSVKMEISYKMAPIIDANDSFASGYGTTGDGLYNNVHTATQCTSAGGTPFCSPSTQTGCTGTGNVPICRFGSSIPGGWTAYGSWSQTSPNSCSGIYAYNGRFSPIPSAYAACSNGSCTTGSHAWSNTGQETCSYQDASCTFYTCYAGYTYLGAY